jgi:hypothetical protein
LRVAFVVGFYDPVRNHLTEHYQEYLSNQSIIWIRQIAPNREGNLTELSTRLFDRIANGAASILIILAVPRGRHWVINSVNQILERGKSEHPSVSFQIETLENLGGAKRIAELIEEFGAASPQRISLQQVRERIGRDSVLCMSMDGRTSIIDALRRVGFDDDAIDFFVEEKIAGARNSNLMDHIDGRSEVHSYLLYAWDGLRTLKPEIKKKFKKSYEGANAAQVASLFRKWILSGG